MQIKLFNFLFYSNYTEYQEMKIIKNSSIFNNTFAYIKIACDILLFEKIKIKNQKSKSKIKIQNEKILKEKEEKKKCIVISFWWGW